MELLSKRLASLSESQTMAMNQKSQDLQAQGIDVVNLSVGEPDFFTPDHIKQAAKEAVDQNYSFYSPGDGYMDLRKAAAAKFKNENNLDYTPQQIIVSNGAKHSLANAIMAVVDDGDEVIVPAPYWVTYVELVKLAGGKNVVIQATIENDYKVTPAELEAAITPKTKAFILCSPSNPTGSVYTKEELKAIAGIIAKHPRIMIIADEIYEHINFVGKHESIAQFDNVKDRTIIINGVSKCYAMTGYRIGFMAAPLWVAKACSKLQSQFTSGPSSIAQRAAVKALTEQTSFTEDMKGVFKRRRDLVLQGLSEIPGLKYNIPQGAFYVFPDVSYYFGKSDGETTIKDCSDISLYLLGKAYVATVPGDAFGEPKCIRLSYATSDEKLKKAMASMKEAFAKLK
ncbi:MAG: pyridoxal phosphate-dependent aminotransferase [Bacteroidales bacterium]|jgi:aspartate aminotransferase|nr:pyridoxal phosphate-dependent aminotransferase [Bacteroidales bacterium]